MTAHRTAARPRRPLKMVFSLIAMLLVVCCCTGVLSPTAHAATKTKVSSSDQKKIDELEQKKKELADQIAQRKERIKELENEKETILQLQDELVVLIAETEEQIETVREQIALRAAQIERKQYELDNKSEEIEDSKELLRVRLRAMQHSNTQSNLSVIFGADNFSDMLSVSKAFERISQKDREIIDHLLYQKANIEEIKASIEADKAEMEAQEAELDSLNEELENRQEKNRQTLKKIDANKTELEKQQDAAEKESKQIQTDISAIYKTYESMPVLLDGKFIWPVPGYSSISSKFGWRTLMGRKEFHTGMDITGSGIKNAKIVASSEGKVVAVVIKTSGYGKYLIIDHGGGFSTLYAHCNEILVKQGDYVKKGQEIARVGSTGRSTGNHLHFEVRKNGVAVNPASYVRYSK